MRKIIFLLSTLILIFFTCLGISLLIKNTFNIDSDYLSATATLFAAFVAYYLFNDWRDQERFKLLEETSKNIRGSSKQMLKNYYALINAVTIEIVDSDPPFKNTFDDLFFEFINIFDEFELNIIRYRGLLFGMTCDKSGVLSFYISNRMREIILKHKKLINSIYEVDLDSGDASDILKGVFKETDYLVFFAESQEIISFKIEEFHDQLLKK